MLSVIGFSSGSPGAGGRDYQAETGGCLGQRRFEAFQKEVQIPKPPSFYFVDLPRGLGSSLLHGWHKTGAGLAESRSLRLV